MVKATKKGSKSKSKVPAKKKISKSNRTSTMAATINEKNKGMKRRSRVSLTKTMKDTIAEAHVPTPAKPAKGSAKKSSGKKSAGKRSAGKRSTKKK